MNLIPYAKLKKFETSRETTEYLRFCTYLLKNCTNSKPTVQKAVPQTINKPILALKNVPINHPANPDLLVKEISLLPAQQRLVENGDFDVYYAQAKQIPFVSCEISWLRELTFRKSGEGTGNSCDFDSYDAYYNHLFIWHRVENEVVGAYRIGAGDEILPRYGVKGFYISSFYKLKPQFTQQILPALEVGRAFIQPKYQKMYSSLLLLWKGISHFVFQHPQYRYFFGTVSISDEYQPVSKQMIISFLKSHHYLPKLAKFVKALIPVDRIYSQNLTKKISQYASPDINELSEIISNIETDCKGVPILIKQYLKHGGKFVGFSFDPDFGNVFDGLILVDLLETDPNILERHMGWKGVEGFLQYHQFNEQNVAVKISRY